MKVKLTQWGKNDKRKVNIQIDKFDTWNMYNDLSMIIYPMLVQLKNHKQGVPASFADVGGENYIHQQSFDFYEETNREAFDESCKRWDEILDKMIWSFQQLADGDWEDKYYHGEAKFDWEETDPMLNPVTNQMEPMYKMVDLNPTDHWIDIAGLELHQKKIQEGIDLFAKYYMNLWD
jgi:hypothetical protein